MAVLFSAPLFAADNILTPDANSFGEKYEPNVNVSGQAQVGFMLNNTIDHTKRRSQQDKVDLRSLNAHFLSTGGLKDEVICYRLASRDGIYSAKWKTTLSENIKKGSSTPNIYQVRIESANEDKIQNYTTRELVAIATIGADCKDSNRRYIASSWGDVDVTQEQFTYTLYLNADATQTTVHARATKHKDTAGPAPTPIKNPCILIPGSEKTIAFDTECLFNIHQTHQLQKLAVSRVNHSSVLPVLRFPLVQD